MRVVRSLTAQSLLQEGRSMEGGSTMAMAADASVPEAEEISSGGWFSARCFSLK